MVSLPFISKLIWEKKYKTSTENSIEETFTRVARAIGDSDEQKKRFVDVMCSFRFIPGGRILAYAGRGNPKATLSNCYVMRDVDDSMDGIMESLKDCALTMKAGGGIGLNFSRLRPRGSYITGTDSRSSGPVSFMQMWNSMSRTIAGVGHRKGAMMAVLNIDHPDIEEFITSKNNNTPDNPVLEMFNISVAVYDEFIKAVMEDKHWELKFGGKLFKTVQSRKLWNMIVESNWQRAEPGVIFIDRVNKTNNLWYCEAITATNPCGEQPLPPGGACTLGAINLTQFVIAPFTKKAEIDLTALEKTVEIAVEFLDNTVDKNYYPLQYQREEAQNKRRIGLGIMGLGSMLAMLGVRYDSPEALSVIDRVMGCIRDTAYMSSVRLARDKGSFPLFDKKKYLYENAESFAYNLPSHIKKEIEEYGIRNSHLLTVAPTGSIAQLAGNVSSGVEPIFALSYMRRNYNEDFEVEDYAWSSYPDKNKTGKPQYFVTAHEISPEWHIKVMAQVQKYVDASISKTINLPKETTVEQMQDIYMLAYQAGLKGCTVYRAGSLDEVIKKKDDSKKETHLHSQFTRPYSLEGVTYKVKLPESKHAFYLTFTHYKKDGKVKPVELFVNTKDPAVEEWTKAFGRIISAVFRNVEDPSFLAEELKEVMGRSGFWSAQRRKWVPSLIAEFGNVMQDYFFQIGLMEPEVPVEVYEREVSHNPGSLAYCRVCGQQALVYEEGCLKCLACGYTKCG